MRCCYYIKMLEDYYSIVIGAVIQKMNIKNIKWLIYASKIMYNEYQGSIQPPTKNPKGFSEIH